MESDKTVYYGFKITPFMLGLMTIFFSIHTYLFPDSYVYGENSGPPDIWTTIIFVLIGLLIILLGVLLIDKLVIVEMDDSAIKIKKGDKELNVKWHDVESISMIPTVTPPLYKMRLKNYGDYFLFNTSNWGLRLWNFIIDLSDMGKLIRKKRTTLIFKIKKMRDTYLGTSASKLPKGVGIPQTRISETI